MKKIEFHKPHLQFHPIKDISDLPPSLLLLEHYTHLPKGKFPHKRSHLHPHIVLPLASLRQTPHVPNRRHHMLPIQMAISIVRKVLHHLLRSPLDPLRRLSSGALISPQNTEVLRLGLDDPAGVVVGERLFGVFGPGFWPCGVAVAERPGVGGHR